MYVTEGTGGICNRNRGYREHMHPTFCILSTSLATGHRRLLNMVVNVQPDLFLNTYDLIKRG